MKPINMKNTIDWQCVWSLRSLFLCRKPVKPDSGQNTIDAIPKQRELQNEQDHDQSNGMQNFRKNKKKFGISFTKIEKQRFSEGRK